MKPSTLEYLQACSKAVAEDLTNPSAEQIRIVEANVAEVKRNSQAYLEKLEQGMWESYQRIRR